MCITPFDYISVSPSSCPMHKQRREYTRATQFKVKDSSDEQCVGRRRDCTPKARWPSTCVALPAPKCPSQTAALSAWSCSTVLDSRILGSVAQSHTMQHCPAHYYTATHLASLPPSKGITSHSTAQPSPAQPSPAQPSPAQLRPFAAPHCAAAHRTAGLTT